MDSKVRKKRERKPVILDVVCEASGILYTHIIGYGLSVQKVLQLLLNKKHARAS
jgi:hypothetical protein